MNIHFGNPNPIKEVADAVLLYGRREFESATRSTVPMLTLLMHAHDLFDQIVREIGFPGKYDLFLEYTVGPFKGKGKPSHTDVMLKAGQDSLAIEGKWTEPMYATVRDWPKKGKPRTQNQEAVLQGWLEVLSKRGTTSFNQRGLDVIVYQMIHRAASAAFVGERPRLAYFLFKPSRDPRAATPDGVFEKLTKLWHLLGKPTGFPFHVVEIETKPLEAFETLLSLAKGKEATAEAVCAALQDSTPLFQFGDHKTRPIGKEARQ